MIYSTLLCVPETENRPTLRAAVVLRLQNHEQAVPKGPESQQANITDPSVLEPSQVFGYPSSGTSTVANHSRETILLVLIAYMQDKVMELFNRKSLPFNLLQGNKLFLNVVGWK